MSDILRKYLAPPFGVGGTNPTIEAIHRALEQPAEADPTVVAYLDAHPDIGRVLRSLGLSPEGERFGGGGVGDGA